MRCLTGAILLLISGAVWPCCGVGPAGIPIRFASQMNLVVWDSAQHMEHFVRRANFHSKAADFGFIAPTPSVPLLSAVDEKVFRLLASLKPNPIFEVGAGAEPASKSKGITVVQEMDVAGYHATTVKASDSAELGKWMKEHDYVTSTGIQTWTKKYIDKGWYLTLFRVLGDRFESSTGTVRMSFKTDIPFNPYYVPAENAPTDSAQLSLYFLSAERYEGLIGGKEQWVSSDWEANVDDAVLPKIEEQLHLKSGELPRGLHLAYYVDPHFGEAIADDLYFHPKPVPYALYGFGVGLCLFGGWTTLRYMKRKRVKGNESTLP